MEHEREQLSALLDGELTEADRAAVTAHLAQCADCRAYLAELTALHDALGAWEDEPVPDGFAEGVMERLRRETAPKRKPRRTWRGAAAIAACAAVALLAIHSVPRMGGAAESAPAAAESRAMEEVAPAASAQADTTEDMLETQMLFLTGGAAETPAEAAESRAMEEVAPAASAQADTTEDMLETQMLFLTGGAAETPAEAAEGLRALTEDTDGGATENSAAKTAEEETATDALTLAGEGAADWLAAHGEATEDGRWRVLVEALDELPDTLTLTGIQRPDDGAVYVALEETEVAP